MITDQQKLAIEAAWINRARVLGYKPGTKKYAVQQVEFFAGAMQTLQALLPNKDKPDELSSAIPPGWYMFSMCGRDIITGK